jgi:cyanophycinase
LRIVIQAEKMFLTATPPGILALVGAGEFLESMRPVDAELLRHAGGRMVAILPTASAPDGPGIPERWAAMGEAHFRSLGANATPVMALDRQGCQTAGNVEAVRRADLVYISGGKPGYLLHTLRSTPLWEAVLAVLARGGVVAGCSAGAMILGGWIPGRLNLRQLPFWERAFGLVPQAVVLPHFDEFPSWVAAGLAAIRPRRTFVIGLDGGTALVGQGHDWKTLGRGAVTILGGGRRQRFTAGETVRL